MKIKNIDNVPLETVTMKGVESTKIQWLCGPDEAVPTFAMRRFVMAPGGSIPIHGHHWEHEIFILKGRAEVFTDNETTNIKAGDVIYLPPDELHGYRNVGDEDLEFLCLVPNSAVA